MEQFTLSPSLEPPITELFIGKNILKTSFFTETCAMLSSRIALLSDATVSSYYIEEILSTLKKEGLTVDKFTFMAGEVSKSRETLLTIENALFQHKIGRDTLLIVMGGGVATDLGGFIASTYMRGLPLILIPTTLLGMVDASIGGKTAINTSFGKNLIGTFYHPKAIFSDLHTLSTLPEKEWLNGLAEILKMGLIRSPELWKLCANDPFQWKDPVHLQKIVKIACKNKIEVIEHDPTEKGLRRILNFGHTVAHALENMSEYHGAHGEAVALGSLAESYLSWVTGHLPEAVLKDIEKIYRNAGFSLRLDAHFNHKDFCEAMRLDKKSKDKQIRFVLIEAIGKAIPFGGEHCTPVSQNEIDQMISWMELNFQE